jgi:phage baseplate assembly protein W
MSRDMDAGQIFGRSLGFPPRVDEAGHLTWSEGDANVRESIQIILMTELNERIRLPQFGAGLGKFLFEPNTVSTRQLIKTRIEDAIAAWEPRVKLESVSVDENPSDPYSAVALIQYRLVATQARERVSVNVQLKG